MKNPQSKLDKLSSSQLQAVLYVIMNIASGTGIIFANKFVLSVYKFHFVYALTLIHTTVTMVGTTLFKYHFETEYLKESLKLSV